MEILTAGLKALTSSIPILFSKQEKEVEISHPAPSPPTFNNNSDPVLELGEAKVHDGPHSFTVRMDVEPSFKPDDLLVRTVQGTLIIEGRHDERSDPTEQISTALSFMRTFHLPDNCNVDGLICQIGSGGTLIVTIPKIAEEEAEGTDEAGRKVHRVQQRTPHIWHIWHPRCASPLPYYCVSGVHRNADTLVVRLKIPQFEATDVSVKTLGSYLYVEGAHEKQVDGLDLVKRSFKRGYLLPGSADKDHIKCEMGTRGELTIILPLIHDEESHLEKIYSIVQK